MTIPAMHELFDLSGRIVLVTGGARGIGAAIARRLAQAGADIAISCLTSRDQAEQVAKRVTELGRRALIAPADTTSSSQVEDMVDEVVEAFGSIDVLVNNAGLYPLAALEAMTESEWDRVVDTNLKGVFLCTQAVARAMTARKQGGSIVNIASIEGESPAPMHSHYNAAKAGVLMHTRAAALELGEHGIRVNSVSPGLIWRQGIEQDWPEGVRQWERVAPLTRLGQPEDVADACLFFAAAASRWITGANLRVDGGMMARPLF